MNDEKAVTTGTRLRTMLVVLAAAALLGACSKSNSADSSGASTGSSGNWDSMSWDQGNWS